MKSYNVRVALAVPIFVGINSLGRALLSVSWPLLHHNHVDVATATVLYIFGALSFANFACAIYLRLVVKIKSKQA